MLRDGSSKEIPVEEIVPGDIVILNAGDIVPGDVLVQEFKICATASSALLLLRNIPLEGP